MTEKQMYLTSKRLVEPEGAPFGKADKGTETEWYEYHPIGSFWVLSPLEMFQFFVSLSQGNTLIAWMIVSRWNEDGISKKKGFLKQCPLVSTDQIVIHSNIGSYTTRNAQLKMIHNTIWNDWSPYATFSNPASKKTSVKVVTWRSSDAFKLCWVGCWVWLTKPMVG